MFKFLRNLILLLLALIIIALIALYFYLGAVIKYGVEKFVPPITGTPVTVGNVDISLTQGTATVQNLAVGNPKGFSIPNAFSLGRITVSVDLKSLLTDKIIVKQVLISKPVASVELSGGRMNLTTINDNVQKFISSGATEPVKPEAKTESKSQKTVVIRDLRFTDGALQLGALGKSVEVPLPDISKQNIGEKSNKTVAQSIAEVLSVFSLESVTAAGKSIVNLGKETIQGGIDAAKGAADTVTNSVSSGVDSVKGGVNSVKDSVKSLKNLF